MTSGCALTVRISHLLRDFRTAMCASHRSGCPGHSFSTCRALMGHAAVPVMSRIRSPQTQFSFAEWYQRPWRSTACTWKARAIDVRMDGFPRDAQDVELGAANWRRGAVLDS